MNCACGIDLGRVTLKTKGLCPSCGRSKWLQACTRHIPKSNAIASGLNKRQSMECVHRTTSCFTRCGVRLVVGGWVVITPAERENWFCEVNAIAIKDREGPIV